MNQGIFKLLLLTSGTLLIGFGLGLIVGREIIVNQYQYLIGIVGSLILGGFFLALGRKKRLPKKDPSSKKENSISDYPEGEE